VPTRSPPTQRVGVQDGAVPAATTSPIRAQQPPRLRARIGGRSAARSRPKGGEHRRVGAAYQPANADSSRRFCHAQTSTTTPMANVSTLITTSTTTPLLSTER